MRLKSANSRPIILVETYMEKKERREIPWQTSILAIALVLVIAYLIHSFIPAVWSRARPSARRTSCASHLSLIGKALEMYADVNQGQYPGQLPDLYPEFIKDPRAFQSPLVEAAEMNPSSSMRCDYLYVPIRKPTSGVTILVLGPKSGLGNGRSGRNVLVISGSVEFVDEDAALIKTISAQLATSGMSLEDVSKNPPQYQPAIERLRRELGLEIAP